MSTTNIDPARSDLLVAQTRASARDTLLNVVDQSIRRSAELRREREAREAEARVIEDRRNRAEEAERIEREDAEAVTQRAREQADEIVTRSEERRREDEALDARSPFNTTSLIDTLA